MLIGSLFAGIGGLDLACEWAWPGSRTVWQLDQVNAAVRRRHWPDALQVEADVTTVDPLALPAVDVLCAGFPCQDLSVAGKQAGLDGERSGIYREVPRFTAAIQPRYVVIENVSGLLRYMPRLCEDFRALGYGLSWTLCEAADAGHPHLRRRVFVLAERGVSGRGLVEVDRRGRWTGQESREWGTPRVGNGGVGGERENDRSRVEDQVQTWATVRADDARGPGRQERDDGMDYGLSVQVRPWPTTTATDARSSGAEGYSTESVRHAGVTLTDAVRPWPTVVSRDYKTGELPDRAGSEALSSAAGAATMGTWGRRLNAAWVEALMGYPPGWTEPTGPRLECSRNAPAVRGRYPATWDRSVPWPGYAWEPSRTIPDGPAVPGRPARVKAVGNAVCPQQAALALDTLPDRDERQRRLW